MNPTVKKALKGIGRYIPNAIYWRVTPLLLKDAFGAVKRKPARHFVDIWQSHFSAAQANGMKMPDSVVEIGPGGAVGVGFCALLAGATRYVGLDEVDHASQSLNTEIFEELIKLEDWSGISRERIEAIERAIRNQPNSLGIELSYKTPMVAAAEIESGSFDFLITSVVMEHVDNIAETYELCARLLKPDGMMSHLIDFSCHGTANRWNGHWSYDSDTWRKIRGERPYLLNRAPYSAHLEAIAKLPFEIISTERATRTDGMVRSDLAEEFTNISGEDLTTRSVQIQARRLPDEKVSKPN